MCRQAQQSTISAARIATRITSCDKSRCGQVRTGLKHGIEHKAGTHWGWGRAKPGAPQQTAPGSWWTGRVHARQRTRTAGSPGPTHQRPWSTGAAPRTAQGPCSRGCPAASPAPPVNESHCEQSTGCFARGQPERSVWQLVGQSLDYRVLSGKGEGLHVHPVACSACMLMHGQTIQQPG